MHTHSNASTNQKQRSYLSHSKDTCSALARALHVSRSTTWKWKGRESVQDRSSKPHNLRDGMGQDCKLAALLVRKQGLTLDECLDSLTPCWNVSRSALHRFFQSQGVGNLRAPKKAVGTFKAYEPGFLHIDSTYLPCIKGQTRFVFVAIDRATRLAFVGVYNARNAANALDFFTQACKFFPFHIHKVLTDNGAEFTNKSFRRWPSSKTKLHPFEQLLQALQISHRFTKPYTPQTNGLVERFNRTLKDATLKKRRYDEHSKLEQDITDWIRIYNSIRKHTGIQRRTPLQEASRWYILKPEIFTRDPGLLEGETFATCRD